MVPRNPIEPTWWDTQFHGGVHMRQILAARDIGAVFGFLHSRGWSWAAIARATDLGDQRVREIASGRRKVENYDVFLRIAAGLEIPKSYLGLGLQKPDHQPATELAHAAVSDADRYTPIPQYPNGPDPITHLDDQKRSDLGHMAGNTIYLDNRIEIRIGSDGAACVAYRYEIFNLTDRPLTRLARDLWFKYTDGGLEIAPAPDCSRRVVIQRVHDTLNLAKFSCKLSPAIQPGESATIGYTCRGGRFVDALYWRQSIYRHTCKFAISIWHQWVEELADCSAIEEYPNGSERSVTENLVWDRMEDGMIISLTRENLTPNQSVTVSWGINA
ncbi:helix-turn-helix domain-containing protein [Nocardia sp. NBC_01730]|uniref:helix-turn-helix domain-containing protein n=1 Tax=Nocardia sp. NBC_01730 TaxID=2975998 RepID=UPI002E135B5A|nr:helix-turn-helix domain-containing protein [Nocardia sp. NBC_01730]